VANPHKRLEHLSVPVRIPRPAVILSHITQGIKASKAPARRGPDDNIFQFGARFGRKRCAASAHRPLCLSDHCRLLCALSAHCLTC
jgi:hypothetical protein